MTAKVILNPYSNRWQAKTNWPLVDTELKRAGIQFELSVSERPGGHVTELAAEATSRGFSPILVAGGDGTIGEVVNGMAQASRDKKKQLGPLGIIPLGTANDLAHNLKLPLDIPSAVTVIAAGNTSNLDVCQVNDRLFVNNAAIGLEPTVTVIQQEMTKVKGILRYLLATLCAINRNPKWQARLEWDGGKYEGPISLVTVGNGAVTGGLFYMTPHADPFDGKLTFVHAYRKTRWEMLKTLPRTMKPATGSYVELPGVHEIHARWLKVHLETPTPAHSDGELFNLAIKDLEYTIHPGKLLYFSK
ncbi:MAG: diacylglycerol kinase family lipid kinase [Anaerolineaceae bacterium]|nr:diacylglycerol kinase family lipid kinase [Anaerolineaceae bacterium]MBN2677040.1 diacylglycerol kinase family lipid kinase [Anaerolineaceae bacterium]